MMETTVSLKKENVAIFDHSWQIIANPNALSNSCYKHWEEIAVKLDELQLDYQFYITDDAESGKKLAAELCRNGHRHLMAMGGDGTVNQIVDGIMNSGVPSEEVYLAVLPLGTGNDWCRTHHYPRPYMESINILLRGQFVRHDIGLVECLHDGQVSSRHHFINIAGFGFDAAIIHKTAQTRSRINLKAVYLLTLFKVLFSHKAQQVRIRTERETVEEPLFSIAVGICRYNGNGMMQVPMADPADGLFHIMRLRKISPFKVIRNVNNLYSGKLEHLPEISYTAASDICLESDKPLLGEIEGDTLPTATYHIRMLPGALNMLTGL
ncbi:MAG: diacylglycerol kinase family lipid kinase [Bacteroidales bacterium]|nr:diacylglycerol kinase family lipid kinase [Bacteroidales bacterium]